MFTMINDKKTSKNHFIFNSSKIFLFATFFLLFAFNSLPLISQVNTEILRKDPDETGWFNSLGLAIGYSDGNTEYQNYEANVRSDIVFNTMRAFVQMNYQFKQAEEKTLTNKAFVHLRYIAELVKHLEAEAFGQQEFNEFISLKERVLAGGGLRTGFQIGKDTSEKSEPVLAIYFGAGLMYEYESYELKSAEIMRLARSTNYLNFTLNLNDYLSLGNVTYYQADVQNFKDYRILNDSVLEIKINNWLSLTTTLAYRYDSMPQPGIEKYDIEIKNGLTVRFSQKR